MENLNLGTAVATANYELEQNSSFEIKSGQKDVNSINKMRPMAAVNLYDLEERKGNENFSEFLTKALGDNAFSSVFSTKSVEDFFSDVKDFYNPYREVAQKYETISDAIEIPTITKVSYGVGSDYLKETKAVDEVVIRMFPFYAKTERTLMFLSKIAANETKFKQFLGYFVSNAEREMFTNGTGKNMPLGVLKTKSITDKATNINVNRADINRLADEIYSMKMSLSTDFSHNACFMVSKNIKAKMGLLKDSTGRYLFKDDSWFEHKVFDMEELGDDNILFGNFEHGYVVCDQARPEIHVHKLFDPAWNVGIIYSSRCGAGVTDPNAIKLAKVVIA